MNLAEEVNVDASRILIVDDDEIIRKLLRRVLERSGFIVDEAASGEDAFESINDSRPDLILLDVVMDGIDGFATCRQIKSIEGMDEIPVIFVTGRSDTSSIVEGLQVGGSDYITKPINRHEALARIRNHLKMRVLMRLQREFTDGLKETNLAKNRILGVASHDLRNPIAAIRGLADFLGELGPLNEQQQEVVDTIRSTSNSMLQLVDELLDLSVIESGEEGCELEAWPVLDAVNSSLNIYKFIAQKKNTELQFENRGGVPELLMLDKVQFRRLIDNLLSNAIKYSPSCSSIVVTIEMEEEILRFVVEDEGPGIPEDETHKLFTEFGKTSVRPSAGESSTGLGLSICKKIAEAHHGRVFFENRKDRTGARFVIELNTAALAVSPESQKA